MNDICRPELDGLKPYKPGKPISEVQCELKLKKVIKLASNESPYPPFPRAIAAVERIFRDLNRYPDANCTALKGRLASFLDVPEPNIMIGNGSNELIRLIANAVLNPGEEVIFAKPSFIVYPTVTRMMGGICREIPLNNFRHDLPAMLKAISEKTKMIIICNPNNPTGTIVFEDEVSEFLEKIRGGVVVVFDEAYFEYVEDERYPDGIDYFRQGKLVAILRTFSKIYSLAGFRIGYGVAPNFLVEAVSKIREPFNVNALAQVAALASLDCQDEVIRRKRLNAEGKRYLYGEFETLGLECVPTEANFIWVNVERDSREIFKKLLHRGVIVRTGDIFGYDTYLRVTIGTREENEEFIAALKEVLKDR
ncbi:MAG: histidinol-phosphate transaminase [Actinomycetota bacterium]